METNIARKEMKEWEELAFGSEEDDKYNRTIGTKKGGGRVCGVEYGAPKTDHILIRTLESRLTDARYLHLSLSPSQTNKHTFNQAKPVGSTRNHGKAADEDAVQEGAPRCIEAAHFTPL